MRDGQDYLDTIDLSIGYMFLKIVMWMDLLVTGYLLGYSTTFNPSHPSFKNKQQ